MADEGRLDLPAAAIEFGQLAYAALATDSESSRLFSERQLTAIRVAESELGRALHKGQALHNLGIVEYRRDREAARDFLHAAHIEDLRTYGVDALAADVLVNGLRERPAALRDLAEFVAGRDGDALELAQQFADEYGPFGEHRNYLAGTRDEAELDAVERSRQIFVAGSYGVVPHHIVAIATGVVGGGLMPVVVGEFADAPGDNDFTKSVRYLDRCGAAIVDVTVPAGQWLELGLLYRADIPTLLVFSSSSVDASVHGGMVRGVAETIGAEVRACTTTSQMEEETRSWTTSIRKRGGAAPVVLFDRPGPQLILTQSGSNTRLATPPHDVEPFDLGAGSGGYADDDTEEPPDEPY